MLAEVRRTLLLLARSTQAHTQEIEAGILHQITTHHYNLVLNTYLLTAPAQQSLTVQMIHKHMLIIFFNRSNR